jgi:hypothetical protein
MAEAKLERKLREIHKALGTEIDEQYFTPLYEDAMCWKSWNTLHVVAEAMSCNATYVLLIEECLKSATRSFLGDIC